MLGRLRLTVVLLALLLPWHGAAQAWLVALGPAHHHAWDDAAVAQVCCAPAPPTHHHADDDDSVLFDHEHDEELTDTRTAGAAAQPALPVRPAGCLPPGEVVQSPGLIPVWRSVSQQPPQRPPSALLA